MEKVLSVRHLLGIKELTRQDIELIFQTADGFKKQLNSPNRRSDSLQHLTIANVFFENSTRTRLSFELAAKRLSAEVINFSSTGSSVEKGETLLDTIRNIVAMKVDMIVLRHFESGVGYSLSESVNTIFVNAGDGTNEHPTQALLDAYTIRQKHGEVAGKKVAIIGDIMHSRVARSNILCLQKLGAEVMVCGPESLVPPDITNLGVQVETDVRKALSWCNVANVLRIQLERQEMRYISSLEEYARTFGINKKMMEDLNKPITIMHPGPINRGVELTSEVADSEHSVILEQVENGVAIRMAVLHLLGTR